MAGKRIAEASDGPFDKLRAGRAYRTYGPGVAKRLPASPRAMPDTMPGTAKWIGVDRVDEGQAERERPFRMQHAGDC